MMQQVLYIDEMTQVGMNRFKGIEAAVGKDVGVEFADNAARAAGFAFSRGDLLVADIRGLSITQRRVISRILKSNPDVLLIFVAEERDKDVADAMLVHGAIDCVSPADGYDDLGLTIRKTLARLLMVRRTITSMNSRVEEFDATFAVGSSPESVSSLAKYLLRHVAQMDVCGLRDQFRAVRALEEVLNEFNSDLSVKNVNTKDERFRETMAHQWGEATSTGFESGLRVRIHLSQDGFRFTVRTGDPSGVSLSNTTMTAIDTSAGQLWFSHLFMDEIEIDPSHHEITMLKLADHVCRDVHAAIARRRGSQERKPDLLTDVLKAVEGRNNI